MSVFEDRSKELPQLGAGCSCGVHRSQLEHEIVATEDQLVEQAVMRALIPDGNVRRRFLTAVGAGTAAAPLSTFFPLAAAKEAFARGGGEVEKDRRKGRVIT